MNMGNWIGFVALRYIFTGRKSSPSSIFSILGIATGVLALIVIIAVMNGFQMGFIESILEISSGHLRLEGSINDDPDEIAYNELIDRLRNVPGIVSVLPYREYNVLVRGGSVNPRGALIRSVPPDALYIDPGLAGRLEFEGGFFDLDTPDSIVIGAELARHLFVWIGDTINLLSITGGIGGGTDDESHVYTITGIFRSGFYEFDLGWAFIGIDRGRELSQEPVAPVLGIKIRNRWQEQRAMEDVKRVITEMNIASSNLSISSWRDYNRAFFGALRTEKLMMFILLGLIFIVVGLNIYQSQRRIVLERQEEIGLLRALGASERAVRLIFAWDGLIIGFTGAGIGLVLGLIVSFNVPAFFSLLENLVNFSISLLNQISHALGIGAGQGQFAIFSPQIFYLKEIPSRPVFLEVALIFLFGLLSALLAAWFASGKVTGARPAEVLRYE